MPETRALSDRLRLIMLSGSFQYDSHDSLTVLRDYLTENIPVDSQIITWQSEDDAVSLEPIDQADVLMVFTRRLNTAGPELERIQRYCEQGRPVVGLRTASHAFQNWLDFDRLVLGGNYQGHRDAGPPVQVDAADGTSEHQVLADVMAFEATGSLYRNTPLAEDTTPLLSGSTDEHAEPVAWTRQHHGGRIFYTSLGHPRDFWELDFLRLIENAVMWVAGRGC